MALAGTVAGLRLRPYAGEADLADNARIENAEAAEDGLQRRFSIEELASFFARSSDSFDPARDVTIAELDGRVVGVGQREIVDTTDTRREYRIHRTVSACTT